MRVDQNVMMLAPLLLLLAACGGDKAELDAMDKKLSAKTDADPALTAALEDQIMVDPSLSAQSNDHSIKPAAEPLQTPIPQSQGPAPKQPKPSAPVQTLGGLAAQQAGISRDSFNGCGLNVQYSMDYAAKLPADMPLFPQAQVVEAAGSDDNGCRLRALTMNATGSVKAVAQYYAGAATKAGYRVSAKAEPDGTVISGKRAADGGAFYVIVNAIDGGSTADLVINNGV